jgi:hypothetical protein
MSPSPLQQWQANAVEEAFISRSLAVIAHDGRAPGSGTSLRWHDRTMFLTADHVIRGSAGEEISFLFRPDGPIETRSRQQRNVAVGEPRRLQPRRSIPIKRIHRWETDDLAAIEVDPAEAARYNVIFHTLAPQASSRLGPEQPIAFLGYPRALADTVSPGELALFPSIEYLIEAQPTTNLGNFDAELHLLFRYQPPDQLEPHGYSGAGVWANGPQTSSVWSPNPQFCGVIQAHYAKSGLIRALRVERVIQLLSNIKS